MEQAVPSHTDNNIQIRNGNWYLELRRKRDDRVYMWTFSWMLTSNVKGALTAVRPGCVVETAWLGFLWHVTVEDQITWPPVPNGPVATVVSCHWRVMLVNIVFLFQRGLKRSLCRPRVVPAVCLGSLKKWKNWRSWKSSTREVIWPEKE